MLASVLKSKKAIKISIYIKTFIKLRKLICTHKELAHNLEQFERRIEKNDAEIRAIFEAIRQLMAPIPEKSKRRIGFHPGFLSQQQKKKFRAQSLLKLQKNSLCTDSS